MEVGLKYLRCEEEVEPHDVGGLVVEYTTWDGRMASPDERREALRAFSRKCARRLRDGPPAFPTDCPVEGVLITVNRKDGGRLTPHQVEAALLIDHMYHSERYDAMFSPGSVHMQRKLVLSEAAAIAIFKLPSAALATWLTIVEQLQPGVNPQTVRLRHEAGQALAAAGLVRLGSSGEDLFEVPRSIAYCMFEPG